MVGCYGMYVVVLMLLVVCDSCVYCGCVMGDGLCVCMDFVVCRFCVV